MSDKKDKIKKPKQKKKTTVPSKKMTRFSQAENNLVFRALLLRLKDVEEVIRENKELGHIARFLVTQMPHRTYPTLKTKLNKILLPLKALDKKKTLLNFEVVKDSLCAALLSKSAQSPFMSNSKKSKYMRSKEQETQEFTPHLGKRGITAFLSAEDEGELELMSGQKQIFRGPFMPYMSKFKVHNDNESTKASSVPRGSNIEEKLFGPFIHSNNSSICKKVHAGDFNQDSQMYRINGYEDLGIGFISMSKALESQTSKQTYDYLKNDAHISEFM